MVAWTSDGRRDGRDGARVFEIVGVPKAHEVASCGEIDVMRAELAAEIARVRAAPDLAIENAYTALARGLAKEQSVRRAAEDALSKAANASDVELEKLAGQAVRATSDLLLQVAVQSKNPTLIGAAVGVDVVVDGTVYVSQLVRASSPADVAEATWSFVKGRGRLCIALLRSSKHSFGPPRLTIGREYFSLVHALARIKTDRDGLKQRLAAAARQVRAIEASVAGLPKDLPAMRAFMVASLEAEAFLLQILATEYSGTQCRTDRTVPPA